MWCLGFIISQYDCTISDVYVKVILLRQPCDWESTSSLSILDPRCIYGAISAMIKLCAISHSPHISLQVMDWQTPRWHHTTETLGHIEVEMNVINILTWEYVHSMICTTKSAISWVSHYYSQKAWHSVLKIIGHININIGIVLPIKLIAC